MRGDSGRYLHWQHFILSLVVIGLGALGFIPIAHADPHAMFYTVIGQQQLFFNVLAALDQADYVETPEQRQSLINQRAATGFKPEGNALLTPTASQLSSVLTRGVTLEGQDLWSAYQAQQLAKEVARRQATSEFVALGCERGLGRVGCSRNPSEWQQNQSFITDAVEWGQRAFNEGVLGILLSGTQEDQDIRKKRLGLDPNDKSYQNEPMIPRAFSNLIASLRSSIDKIQNEDVKKHYKDELTVILQNSARKYLAHPARTDAYNNLEITADGIIRPTFKYSGSGNIITGGDWVNQYLNLIDEREGLIEALNEEIGSGVDFIQAQQSLTAQQGALADLYYDPSIYKDDQGKETIGEIRTTVRTPAYAKLALTNATANAIGNLDQNIMFAPPDAIKTPGNTKLIGPKQPAPGGQVQGAQDGQVLGLLDNPSATAYQEQILDQPNQTNYAPNVNPVSPNREEVITSALKAFAGNNYRVFDPTANNNSCGYCTRLSDVIKKAKGPWI